MNIDERLEAVTQRLELVAGMQQANEKAIAREQRLKRLEQPGSEPPRTTKRPLQPGRLRLCYSRFVKARRQSRTGG